MDSNFTKGKAYKIEPNRLNRFDLGEPVPHTQRYKNNDVVKYNNIYKNNVNKIGKDEIKRQRYEEEEEEEEDYDRKIEINDKIEALIGEEIDEIKMMIMITSKMWILIIMTTIIANENLQGNNAIALIKDWKREDHEKGSGDDYHNNNHTNNKKDNNSIDKAVMEHRRRKKANNNEDYDEKRRAREQSYERRRRNDNDHDDDNYRRKPRSRKELPENPQLRPSSLSSIGSRASSRLSTVSGTPQRQARYFENEIRRQQTHLRRLYAAAEWITTSANSVERTEIEAQINDVEYYIEDLEDQLEDLKQQSRTSSSK